MNLTPFFESTTIIQVHVYAAILALILGAIVLRARKGTKRHKMLGRGWGVMMIFVAVSSFWINEIRVVGPFSPIHLLSILVLVSLFISVHAVRKGNVARHKSTMKQLYFGGLILPGLFTLLPGRLLSEVFIEPVLHTDFVSGDSPSMLDQIIMKTPLWVWPLFIVLLVLGLLHARGYTMPKWRTFILPITFSISALVASLSTTQFFLSILATVVVSVAFLPVGIRFAKMSGASVTAKNQISVPGEWTTFTLIMMVFISRFVVGVVTGVSPDIVSDLLFITAQSAVSGVVVGVALGRTVHYLTMLSKNKEKHLHQIMGGSSHPRTSRSSSKSLMLSSDT